MLTNLEKYRKDLQALVDRGANLHNAIQLECYPEQFRKQFDKQVGGSKAHSKEFSEFIKKVPSFRATYQRWYSEALVVIKQLLPDRVPDFIRLYEKPKNRKNIQYGNYVIEDYLQALSVTRGWEKEKIVGPEAAIPQFEQQLNILKSVEQRFESSLFDIRQLVQADLFDSELDAARELKKNGFLRAAGAMAGVVLEKHLAQVSTNHNVIIRKKLPTISDLNDSLKQSNVIEVATWRFIQHLGDLRNLCDHNKQKDPTPEEAEDLITGVAKISKTLF